VLTRSLHALLGLDADAARAGAVPAFAHGGVLPALVVQNHDAREGRHRMGQVRVAFPCLQDVHPAIAEKDSPLLPWARCLAMGASDGPAGPGRKGPGSGFYAIPQPGDEVLCAFLHGDLHHPVIVGRLWNGKQPLPAPTTALEKDPAVASRRKRDGDPPDLAPLAPACLSSGTKRNDVSLWRSRTGNLVCALDEADARRSLLRIIDRTGATMIELREGRIDIVETPKDVRVLAEAAVRIDCERLEVAARGSARIEVGREGDERGVSNLALISDRGDIAAEVGGRFALGARAAKLRDDLPALGVSLRAGRSLSALAGGSASVVAAQGLMRLEAQAGSVSITAAAGDLSAIAREGISISVAGEAQVRAPELKIHSDGAVNIRTLTRLEWKGAEVFVNANPPTLPQDAWLADTFSLVEDMKEGDPTAVLLESPQAKEALAGVVDLIDAQLGPLDPETRKALEALIQDLAPDLVQALLSGEMSPAEVAKIALDAAMKQGINLLARKAVDFLAKEFQERTGIALSNDDVEFIADLLADLVSGAGTEGCVREAFAYVAQKLLEMARSEIERLAGVRIRTKAWKSFAGKIAEEIKGGTKGNVSGTMDALADLFPALVDLVLDVVLGYVEEELEARVNITLPDGKLPELAAKVTGIVRSVFGEDGRTSKSALTGGLQGVLGQVIDALKDPLCAWLVLEVKRLTKLSLDAAAVAGVFDRVVKPLVAGSFDLVGSLRTIGESLLRCLKDPLIAWARDGVITGALGIPAASVDVAAIGAAFDRISGLVKALGEQQTLDLTGGLDDLLYAAADLVADAVAPHVAAEVKKRAGFDIAPDEVRGAIERAQEALVDGGSFLDPAALQGFAGEIVEVISRGVAGWVKGEVQAKLPGAAIDEARLSADLSGAFDALKDGKLDAALSQVVPAAIGAVKPVAVRRVEDDFRAKSGAALSAADRKRVQDAVEAAAQQAKAAAQGGAVVADLAKVITGLVDAGRGVLPGGGGAAAGKKGK
jgi:hypothetical protein